MTTPTIERKPHRCARNERCVSRVRVGPPADCGCTCHGMANPYATCDIEGGCGHLHQPDPDAEPVFEGGPILTTAGLCFACTRRVAGSIADIPTDYVELSLLLASGESGLTDVIVSGSEELKVPIRVSIEALQAAMVHEATSWAEPVAEQLGIDWDTEQAKHSRPGFRLQRATHLLANSVDALVTLPDQEYRAGRDCEWVTRDGIDGALELLRLHSLVRFAVGKAKLVHELPAPCPRCEALTLVRHNGDDQVQCESCGLRWVEKDYVRLTLVLAEDYQDETPELVRPTLTAMAEGSVGAAGHVEGRDREWPGLPRVGDEECWLNRTSA